MRTGKYSGLDTATFTGKRISQCVLCWEVFSGESTFALHRITGKAIGNPGQYFLGDCRNPEDKGMTLNDHGVWVRKDHYHDKCA
jgi:hypothetical protein